MKKYALLLLVSVLGLTAYAQKATISFQTKTHDFGKINEEDGRVTYVFDFVNTGSAPLVVNRVQASCGCTTPTWTKQPIEPGQKGAITVVYNPAGRPGVFTKTITVYSNATEEQAGLMIKGEVTPKANTNNNPYPVSMGDLKLKSNLVLMNNVDKDKTQIRTLELKNEGKSDLKPVFENLPSYVSVKVVPEVLKPNQVAVATFSLDAKNCHQWGPVNDDIYVNINGQRKYSDEFKVKVIANIVEDFGRMTLDQKRKAPILEAPARTLDFGVVKAGAKKVGKFKVANKGINSLEVRRIINNNRELYVGQSKMTVHSGKTSYLTVDLNTKGLPEGDYKKSITVQTNDPDNSFILLVIAWKVQK